ncbi:hypothetical protein V6N13_035720 [Hibiscus sabdariffa]
MAICCLSSDYEFPVVLSSVFSACSELAEARFALKPDTRVLAESSLRLFESLRLLESHFGVDVVTPPEQLTLLYNSIFDKFDCDAPIYRQREFFPRLSLQDPSFYRQDPSCQRLPLQDPSCHRQDLICQRLPLQDSELPPLFLPAANLL